MQEVHSPRPWGNEILPCAGEGMAGPTCQCPPHTPLRVLAVQATVHARASRATRSLRQAIQMLLFSYLLYHPSRSYSGFISLFIFLWPLCSPFISPLCYKFLLHLKSVVYASLHLTELLDITFVL